MKVHHRPYSFEDGPVVYPANAFDSRLRGDKVPPGSSPTKIKKILLGLAARKRLSLSLPLSFSPSSYFLSFSIQKMNTSCEPHVNGFYDQRPR